MYRNRLNLNRQVTPLPARSDSVTPNSDRRPTASAIPVPKAQDHLRAQYEQRREKMAEGRIAEIVPNHHQPTSQRGPTHSSRPAQATSTHRTAVIAVPMKQEDQRTPALYQQYHSNPVAGPNHRESARNEWPAASREANRVPESVQAAFSERHEQERRHYGPGPGPVTTRGHRRVPLPTRKHQQHTPQPQHRPQQQIQPPPQAPQRLNRHPSDPSLHNEHIASGNPYPPPPSPVLRQSPVKKRPVFEYSSSGHPSSPRVQPQMNVHPNSSPIRERTSVIAADLQPQIAMAEQQQQRSPQMHRSAHPPPPQHHPQQHDIFHAIMNRLDHIAERENVTQAKLEALRISSISVEQERRSTLQLAMEETERKQQERQQDADEKSKKAEKERVDLADGQQRILRYLALLAQHVGEIKRTAMETREVLGINSDAAQALTENVSVETRLDVEMPDVNEEAFAAVLQSSRPGLRGWEPQSKDQSCEYVRGLDSDQQSKGRSVLERLQKMEEMQIVMTEWWEKMKESERLRLEAQKVDGEVQCESGAETVIPPLSSTRITTSPSARSHENEQATLQQAQPPSLSTSASVNTLSSRDSIEIEIADPPPVSSTSTSTLFDARGGSEPTLTVTDARTRHAHIVLNENGASGPVVTIYATGNAGLQLLELAKKVVENERLSNETVTSKGVEKGPETMEVDVFDSRPNLQVDVRTESVKKSQMAQEAVTDTPSTVIRKDNVVSNSASLAVSATSTVPDLHDPTQPSKDASTSTSHNQTSPNAISNEELSPSLKIKIKPIQQRVTSASSHCTAGPEPSFSHSPAVATMGAAASLFRPSPVSIPDSPFKFSPVKDWHKSFSSGVNQVPTSTPHRLLRSSSRPQAGPSPHPDIGSPMAQQSPVKTPRTRNAQLRMVKTETQEFDMPSTRRVAEHAVQGLLGAQALSPQKSFSLDSIFNPRPTPVTPESAPLVIRIPGSASRKRSGSQRPAGSSHVVLEAKALDESAKLVAERAVKGLLGAQAISPHKSYNVSIDITSPRKTTIALADPPTSSSTYPSTPTSFSLLTKSYTLPTPSEGTVAALRQKTLGHPYSHVAVDLGYFRTESKEAKEEELENVGISGDDEVPVETADATIAEMDSQTGDPSIASEASVIEVDESVEVSVFLGSQPADDVHDDRDEPMDDVSSEQIEVQTRSENLAGLVGHMPTPEPVPSLVITEVSEKTADSHLPPSPTVEEPASSPTPVHYAPQRQLSLQSELSPPPPPLQSESLAPATLFSSPAPLINHVEPSALPTSLADPSTSILPHDSISSSPAPFSSLVPIQNALVATMSQSSTSTSAVEEQQVDSLIMDGIDPSSPVKVSVPEFELDAFEDVGPDPMSAIVQDFATPRRPSSSVPSSCSPPDLPAIDLDLDNTLDTHIHTENYVQGIQTEEIETERPLTPMVDDAQPHPPLYTDDDSHQNNDSCDIRTPSPPPCIHPASRAPQGSSPVAEEESLPPAIILQIKSEMDTSEGLLEEEQPTPAVKGKDPITRKPASVPEYLYISDSSPEKRPLKRTSTFNRAKNQPKRAPSIISISSDDDDNQQNGSAPRPSGSKPIQIGATRRTSVAVANDKGEPPRGTKRTSAVPAEQVSSYEEALSATSLFTKELSPMSDVSEPTPPPPDNRNVEQGEQGKTLPVNKGKNVDHTPVSSLDFKKYSAKLDAEDDIPVIPLKKKRKVSGVSEAATEDGSVAGSENPAAPIKKSLLVLAKKGRSAAVTRVRKRKSLPQDSDDEEQPPLKKANLRRDSKPAADSKQDSRSKLKEKVKTREQPVRSPAKKVKFEVPKTPTRRPRGQQKSRTVVWPTIQKPNFDQFIKCDLCECWYHLGCVGVGPNDPSLDDAELYTCPPCVAGVAAPDSESPHKDRQNSDELETTSCSRPKCQCPKKSKKKTQPEEQTYVIESFIGRHRRVIGGKGTLTYYLVKWNGYPISECTWEELIGMRLPNSSVLVQTFETVAAAEMIDIDNSTDEYILLQEAITAGWQPTDGHFVKPE
ncbi:hypothetical protein BDN70DRAFT_880559 [Pholiota conissans]|uniref:Chromo domain-containing protein n=1 Tax=Pholiota conissans TaxID=109636 RepID=A0A9P5YYF7_9AGAR|nr:hypothetical protein BDN70DRAFT_880559 [Pholiota conissans]